MDSQVKSRIRVMLMAVAINTLLVGVRFFVYRLTGSAAVLADGLESIVNIFASAFALYAVWLSKRQDAYHPFGHPAIEAASAALEGMLITIAAGAILHEAIQGGAITDGDAGVLPYVGIAAATFMLGFWLLRTGKWLGSMAIAADGRHAFVDAITGCVVAATLVLVRLTGIRAIDTGAALALAVFISWEGWGLLRRSIPRLVAEGA